MPGRGRPRCRRPVALGTAALLAGCGAPAPEPAASAPAGCPAPPPPVAASSPTAPMTGPPELLTVDVRARHPHDRTAFTQGLAYAGGDELYEGTGRDSDARRVRLADGVPVVTEDLEAPLFGEGLALRGEEVVQLTWQDGVGIVRGRCDLRERRRFTYDGEGWGLADAGDVLWRSDGTDILRALDPTTYAVVREVRVRDRGEPVTRLNELEVVDGQLLANVWQTPWVVRVDPASGRVTGWVDASALAEEVAADVDADPEAVLNGIARDAAGDRLWLTGKLWPTVFEVALRGGTGALPPAGGPG